MNCILLLLPPILALPLIDPLMPSIYKRDDYSFQYFADELKIDLKSTDPDINPLLLCFLLSFILFVLLLSITVAHKLLEIEREKEYDPQDDMTFPAIIPQPDTKQKGLWTVNKSMAPDFKVNNTNRLNSVPVVPDKEDDRNTDEYNRLKKQLESAPEGYRESFMSTSTTPYAKRRESTAVSIYEGTIRNSLNSSYGEMQGSKSFETKNGISNDISTETISSDHGTLDTGIDYPMTSINNDHGTLDTGIDYTMSSINSSIIERDTSIESLNDYKPNTSKARNRKSIIPSSRLSRLSVMTTDSLL